MFGGTTFGHAREKVMRNVLDFETVEVELPTVAKTTKSQGQLMDFRVSMCVCVCVCVCRERERERERGREGEEKREGGGRERRERETETERESRDYTLYKATCTCTYLSKDTYIILVHV